MSPRVTVESTRQVLATDVISPYRAFVAADALVWLMGGWGVDALLGRQARPHHDLDVLVGTQRSSEMFAGLGGDAHRSHPG